MSYHVASALAKKCKQSVVKHASPCDIVHAFSCDLVLRVKAICCNISRLFFVCAYVLMQCRMLQHLDVCLLCRVIQGGREGQIVGIYPVSRTCAYYFCGFRASEVGEPLHFCCERSLFAARRPLHLVPCSMTRAGKVVTDMPVLCRDAGCARVAMRIQGVRNDVLVITDSDKV